MKINHIAIWTSDLEQLREFYINYFKAKSSKKYLNEKTKFESYFLSFDEGSRLEIMYMPTIEESLSASKSYIGLAHFSLSVGSKEEVVLLTEILKQDGFEIVSEPRTTGDGYFESIINDPDGNKVEITV